MPLEPPMRRLRTWIENRKLQRDRVLADTDAMIIQFGDDAYDEARMRAFNARSQRPSDSDAALNHWDRVRREIGRRTGHSRLDTATRYLQD